MTKNKANFQLKMSLIRAIAKNNICKTYLKMRLDSKQ